ncbi:helix-turn-helix transcriptional regulator [Methylibium sp.]|uniref:helix-turn-helix transcriptional regulator n=1 Tax=Methylibium sp. TaxID=2067992 RepID=UPI003BA90907
MPEPKAKSTVDPDKKKAFGKRLKAARITASKTQEQVGDALGVNKVTVSSWELGNNFPDPLTLGRLAQLYGVTIDLLVWDDGISMEAIRVAVQYDALPSPLRRKFDVMWAAYFQQAMDDGEVTAAIARGTGPAPAPAPNKSSANDKAKS